MDRSNCRPTRDLPLAMTPEAESRLLRVTMTAGLSFNNTNSLPPKPGSYWRIDFSHVEWKVHVEGNS